MADINDMEYADAMTQQQIEEHIKKKSKASEKVLCVPVKMIDKYNEFEILVNYESEFLTRGSSDGEFDGVETDKKWKQIITYAVIIRSGLVFCYQRRPKSFDHRLVHKWSIGIGGHVNVGDGKGMQAVNRGFVRELSEEIGVYANRYQPEHIIINAPGKADEDCISDYHVGFCKIITDIGDQQITRSREVVNYGWLPIKDIKKLNLERWSEYVSKEIEEKYPDLLEVK